MILNALERQWSNAIRKKWDKIYIAVDIHDTAIYGNYNENVLPSTFCPGAKETLQYLSERTDICLILYTCSWPTEIEKYQKSFKEYNINFKHVNSNPEVDNNRLGYYSDKFYFNILLEDKAGFDCESDWNKIMSFFKSKPHLTTYKEQVSA